MISEIEQIVNGTVTGVMKSEGANGFEITVYFCHNDEEHCSVTTQTFMSEADAEANAVQLVTEHIA